MITDFNQLDLSKSYTYKDYLSWKFPERVELYLGKIFKMSPAPSSKHQEISSNIHHFFSNYLWTRKCKLFPAPFDVILKEEEKATITQPDLCIICDTSKINLKGCLGAPDLIVEILSPATSSRDLNEKFYLYEANGVLEYWIADPINETILKYNLIDNIYLGEKIKSIEENITSSIFPDLTIDLKDIFHHKK